MNQTIDDVELLSQSEVHERIDPPLLKGQLNHVLRNSGFYREKWSKAGFDPDTLNPGKEILSQLPFTDKSEVLLEQEKHPPYGRLSMRDSFLLRRIHSTSGTTGKTFNIVLTENDIAATVEAGRRAFLCAGLTPDDTVIHCLNYRLWSGGITDHINLEATGAAVIPFGVGKTKLLLETIQSLKPTAISCTPSYMSRLEMVLKEEFNQDPRSLGLKKAFFGGEVGLQNPDVRKKIEDTWGLKAIDANYGLSDVLSIFGSECPARQGIHFHAQGILHVELIDPNSGKLLPFCSEQVGELVLSNIRREAQPLIRYRTNDLVRIVSNDACSCGRKSFRFLEASFGSVLMLPT